MYKNILLNKKIFWFKRWSKKNYSVFASIGKQICISVLTISYSLISFQGFSQQDKSQYPKIISDTLPEVEINSDQTDILKFINIENQIITNIDKFESCSKIELSGLLPGIEIRQRGKLGVQGDLQYRGGSAEQCLIFLNNTPMNNAQTGHHNLNLPIPDICIAKISIYSSGENLSNIAGNYNGLIRYSSFNPDKDKISISLETGSHKFIKTQAMATFKIGRTKNIIAVSNEQSAGYKFNTDFNAKKAYYNFIINTKSSSKINFEAGIINKAFGAESFYSNKYSTQYEKIFNGFSSLSLITNGMISFKPSIYWKRSHDRFELFRESLYTYQNGYYIWNNDTARYNETLFYKGHNYHLTDNIGATMLIETSTNIGNLKAGINHNYDHIYSNVLGNNLALPKRDIFENSVNFYKQANRNTSYIFTSFSSNYFKGFRANAQVNALIYNSNFTFGGGASIYFDINTNFYTWISATVTNRLPSFTELYYKSATNIGNANLNVEIANNYEFGINISKNEINFQNRVFLINGKNTIDWIKNPTTNIYEAMNHTELLTIGNSTSLLYKTKNIIISKFLNQILINYTYIYKDKYSKNLISAYSLDYLRHKLNIVADFPLYKSFSYAISYQYINRNGTYTVNNSEQEYKPWSNLDFSLSYRSKNLSLSFGITNILGTEQIDFGGIILPSRLYNVGIKLNSTKK